MISFGKPTTRAFLVIVGFIAMVAAMAISNSALPAVGQVPGHVGGEGCYCHNNGVAIYANSTDATGRMMLRTIEGGKSFSLLINTTQRDNVSEGLLQAVLAWMPDMGDNAKFGFDPQEVKDNSPQDQSPEAGTIVVLFKITAAEEPGPYAIQLSAQGAIISFILDVKEASPAVFASIINVEAPSLVQAGAPVSMNVTLQNTGSAARRAYMYATDSATGEQILAKVYSTSQIAGNETVTLSGTFAMPNRTLSLVIHTGHEKDGGDIDDDQYTVSIRAPNPLPPTQGPSLHVLAGEWGPWIVVLGASLASVQIVKYAGKRKHAPFARAEERLKLAVVDCALCGGCEVAIADLGQHLLNLLSQKIDLVFAPILMSAREYGPVDVAFVVGSVRTADDVRAVKEARDKAKVLVAFGTCPAFGGLHSLANLYRVDELLDFAYVNAPSMEPGGRKIIPSERIPELTSEVRPLSDYVKVDLTIPGCPPPSPIIRTVIETLLDSAQRGKSQ